jgi:hypothetical protein
MSCRAGLGFRNIFWERAVNQRAHLLRALLTTPPRPRCLLGKQLSETGPRGEAVAHGNDEDLVDFEFHPAIHIGVLISKPSWHSAFYCQCRHGRTNVLAFNQEEEEAFWLWSDGGSFGNGEEVSARPIKERRRFDRPFIKHWKF